MQAGAIGWNWIHAAGLMVSGTVTLGAVAGMFAWKRRRRKQRQEKPPIDENLLRPAGYSAMCRADDLRDKVITELLYTVGAGLMAGLAVTGLAPLGWGLAVGRITLGEVRAPGVASEVLAAALLGLVALVFAVRGVRKLSQVDDEARNWLLGMRGEQAVAEQLHSLIAKGYRVFHDVPSDGTWNIDHVLVGPAGVFAIETKCRTKVAKRHGEPAHKVSFDGKAIHFPLYVDFDSVEQARRNAKWLAGEMSRATGSPVKARGVVALPGWWVECKVPAPEVPVLSGKQIPGWIEGLPNVLPEKVVEQVAYQLDRRCRDVEFPQSLAWGIRMQEPVKNSLMLRHRCGDVMTCRFLRSENPISTSF